MATNPPVKAAPITGLKVWVEAVRTLAPEARIPYIVQIMAEAYEAGVTPQQFVDALSDMRPSTNWVGMPKYWVAKEIFPG